MKKLKNRLKSIISIVLGISLIIGGMYSTAVSADYYWPVSDAESGGNIRITFIDFEKDKKETVSNKAAFAFKNGAKSYPNVWNEYLRATNLVSWDSDAADRGYLKLNNYQTTSTNGNTKYLFDTSAYSAEKVSTYDVEIPKIGSRRTFNSLSQFMQLDPETGKGKVVDGGLGSFMPLGDDNFYFGMTFSTEFYLPESGQVENEDMIFNFSGDDDVWVFIDGKQVLDIGGIHGAIEGTINFYDNTVTYQYLGGRTVVGESGYATQLAGGDYGSAGCNESGEELSFGTCVDDEQGAVIAGLERSTLHTLTFFYLERGAYMSNCAFSYNLPGDDSAIYTVKHMLETGYGTNTYEISEADTQTDLVGAVGSRIDTSTISKKSFDGYSAGTVLEGSSTKALVSGSSVSSDSVVKSDDSSIVYVYYDKLQEYTDISGLKLWNDKDAQASRPAASVDVYRDGELVATVDVESDGTYSLSGLPVYKPGNVKYSYTVREHGEEGGSFVPGNGFNYSVSYNGTTITNTLTDTTSVKVTKKWVTEEDASDFKAQIKLMKGTEQVASYTLTGDETYVFTKDSEGRDLPKYNADGSLVQYYAVEEPIEGYTGTASGNMIEGFVFVNSRKTEDSIKLTKTWVYPFDSSYSHPSAEIVLVGTYGSVSGAAVSGSFTEYYTFESNNSKYQEHIISGLPMTVDGLPVSWSAYEKNVEGYTSILASSTDRQFDFINKISGTKTITVNKVWNAPLDKIPSDISFVIINGLASTDSGYREYKLTLTAEDGWTGSITVPAFSADGTIEYNYSVIELPVEGFTSSPAAVSGDTFSFTNTYDNEKVSVKVVKTWNDSSVIGVAHPSISINLYKNVRGVRSLLQTKTIASGSSYCIFTDLDKYDTNDWSLIEYSVDESIPAEYADKFTSTVTKNAEGFEVRNSFVPKFFTLYVMLHVGPDGKLVESTEKKFREGALYSVNYDYIYNYKGETYFYKYDKGDSLNGVMDSDKYVHIYYLKSEGTPTPTPTGTPEDTPTPTPTGTPVDTPTPTPTGTPEDTPTPTPTGTPEDTPTPTPTGTPEDTPTPTPTGTPTGTPTPTPTGTPVETPTPTPTGTPTGTPTPTPTGTPVETPTPTPTGTPTGTPTPTPTETPTGIPTPTPVEILIPTPPETPEGDPFVTPTPVQEEETEWGEEDELDPSDPRTPQGDPDDEEVTEETDETESTDVKLPKTGVIPAGLLYGLGAALIIFGGYTAMLSKKEEEEEC